MLNWIRVKDEMPPLDEDVLVLYKNATDDFIEDNLYPAIAHRYIWNQKHGLQAWSEYIPYQEYYQVVYWTYINKPDLKDF